MVVELNGIRSTSSAELNGTIAMLKNCATQNRQQEVPKPNSFQTILKKPQEKKQSLEKEVNPSENSLKNIKRNESVDEKRVQMAPNPCDDKSIKDPGSIHKNETKSEVERDLDEGELQLSKPEESHDSSVMRGLDAVDESGYLADNDETDFDQQFSWARHSSRFEETPELSLEESREVIQAQHSVSGDFIVFQNNTRENEQEQIALMQRDHDIKTNAIPTPDSKLTTGPYIKRFHASHTKMGELSSLEMQSRPSLEHEDDITTTQKDLNSREFVSLQSSREMPELMSRGRNDSGVDLLSHDGLERLSSTTSRENAPQMVEERDVVVVGEDVESTLISTPLELMAESTSRESNDFVSTLDDNDAFKMPNKIEGSISFQMNALNQKGEAPLFIAPLRQVAFQLTKALDTRVNHLTFQLDPEHLGKVDVELKIMNDNHVQAIFHVDNPESYELLRRDSAELQALLNEAGFESNANDFSFHYRDPHSNSGEQESSFQSSSRMREQQELNESSLEVGLDVQPFLRRPDPSKTLDTLI